MTEGDGVSPVYKKANITSGQPEIVTGNPQTHPNVVDVGGEFYRGERRIKGQR